MVHLQFLLCPVSPACIAGYQSLLAEKYTSIRNDIMIDIWKIGDKYAHHTYYMSDNLKIGFLCLVGCQSWQCSIERDTDRNRGSLGTWQYLPLYINRISRTTR